MALETVQRRRELTPALHRTTTAPRPVYHAVTRCTKDDPALLDLLAVRRTGFRPQYVPAPRACTRPGCTGQLRADPYDDPDVYECATCGNWETRQSLERSTL